MEITRREFLSQTGLAIGGAAAAGYIGKSALGPALTGTRSQATPVTLTWWTDHPEWVQQVNLLVSEFQKANPHITIQVEAKPGQDYPTLLEAAIAANSAPDIFGVIPGSEYIQYVKAKRLANLTGKLNTSLVLSSSIDVMNLSGKYYGAPILGGYTVGVYYWKPYFAKAHLSPPTTWSEMIKACETLATHGYTPYTMGAADGVDPASVLQNFLSTIYGPETPELVASKKVKLTDDAMLAGFDFVLSLIPYFQPGWASFSYITGKAFFAEGRTAMLQGGSADYTGYKDVNPHVDLGYFAFPHPDTSGYACVGSGHDLLYGVNASASPEVVDAGATFLNFFLTKKVGSQIGQILESPIVKGATVTVPIFETIIQQSKYNGVVWNEVPQLGDLNDYMMKNGARWMLGDISTKTFAAKCQSMIA